jgi:hypothetical protein
MLKKVAKIGQKVKAKLLNVLAIFGLFFSFSKPGQKWRKIKVKPSTVFENNIKG